MISQLLYRLIPLMLLCGLGASLAQANEAELTAFRVESVDPVTRNGYVYLSAFSQLLLPEKPEQALQSGLALYFQVDVGVTQRVRWWPDKQLVEKQVNYRLRFHGLTERYVVENANTGRTQAYRSLGEALKAIGTLTEYPVISTELLDEEGAYFGVYQISLDISQLPTPLRPQAFVSNDWRIKSELVRWRLK